MRKLILAMQTTFDGFAQGIDKDMSWMQPDDEQGWVDTFEMLKNVDLMILGSGMWTEYRDYWKKALHEKGFSASAVKYAKIAEQTKHLVFSKSIKDPGWENASVVSTELKQELIKLKDQPGKDIYLVGGIKFAASAIDSGLVDEFRICINPMIIGKGASFLHDLQTRHQLKLKNAKTLDNGVIIVRYEQQSSVTAEQIGSKK